MKHEISPSMVFTLESHKIDKKYNTATIIISNIQKTPLVSNTWGFTFDHEISMLTF